MKTAKTASLVALLALSLGLVAAADGIAAEASSDHDQELLTFVKRAVAYYPDSTFKITEDERVPTPSGAYRVVTVERSCSNKFLSGPTTVLVDEVTETAWVGSVASLPAAAAGVDPGKLKVFVDGFLPEAIASSLRQKVRIEWKPPGSDRGALLAFDLMVSTGYGQYPKSAAVTADGRWVAMGNALPLDRDPVEYRRQLMLDDRLVIWDHEGEHPAVEIVEFSDLECPGCRRKWSLIKQVLETYKTSVRHGMVSYPMPNIHPWSFRAASAAWCLADQDSSLLLPFKELFYSLQTEMEVSMVTPTVVSFVVGNGLSEEAFRECYLRDPSVDAVHGQLALGQKIGVIATPTYLINGWMVQMPDEEWLMPMIERLMDGHDPA